MKATPQTLIQMAFDAVDGDRHAAATFLTKQAKTNRDLMEHLLRLGASAAVGNLICSDRRTIMRGAPIQKTILRRADPHVTQITAARDRARGRANTEVLMLLDATLHGGKKRMADATKDDLLASAAAYESTAVDAWQKTTYQRTVASRLPEGKTAGQLFSNEALTAIWNESRSNKNMQVAA